MNLTLIGHEDRYAVEQLQMALFPDNPAGAAESALRRGKTWLTATAKITLNGKTARASRRLKASEETVRLRRRVLQQSYYLAAVQLLPKVPAWGALAGVRPTKITTKHLLEGGTPKSAEKLMKDVYYVTEARRKLSVDCSASTVNAVKQMEPEDISVYVGIPFCPTRCTYCSFVSRTIGKKTELLEPYLAALEQEIRFTAELMRKSGKHLRTLYIGGGTPTTLSTHQMIRLLDTLRSSFDFSRCIEFTVEGGRPDTLDFEKLRAIREHGADRMSINPQTMEDSVLRACGRPHKAKDVIRAYQEAVDAGFAAINMDLIAGLPQDDFDGFRRSLDAVAALNPANITVHTLALKKGSRLMEQGGALPSGEETARMLDYSLERLSGKGYLPYYLYRQKYMSGSLENVGWCLSGQESVYNIVMMEELQTVVSIGGGGVTKLVDRAAGTIVRQPNPKYPHDYLAALDRVLAQKEELAACFLPTHN